MTIAFIRAQTLKIILLLTFGQAGPVILSSAFPQVATYFNQSLSAVKWVVTLYFLGFSFGQLFYGPLANRWGRIICFKRGMLFSLIGSLLSVVSVYNHSFYLLLLGRLIEGLGASAAMVVGFTIISDLYSEAQSTRIIGLSMISFALTPALAIFLGGIFVEYASWKYSLWMLFFYGIFALWYVSDLPETLKNKPELLSVKKIAANYFQVCCNKVFLIGSILYGLSNAGIYVFTTEGPFIGSHFLHLSPASYGGYGAFTFVGTLIGGLLAIWLTKSLNTERAMDLGIATEAIIAVLMMSFFLYSMLSISSFFLPVIVWFISNALLVSNANALSLNYSKDKANASAMMSFINNLIAMIVMGVLGCIPLGFSMALPIAWFVLVGLAIMFHTWLKIILISSRST